LVSEFSFHLLHLFDQIFKYYAVVEQEGGVYLWVFLI